MTSLWTMYRNLHILNRNVSIPFTWVMYYADVYSPCYSTQQSHNILHNRSGAMSRRKAFILHFRIYLSNSKARWKDAFILWGLYCHFFSKVCVYTIYLCAILIHCYSNRVISLKSYFRDLVARKITHNGGHIKNWIELIHHCINTMSQCKSS